MEYYFLRFVLRNEKKYLLILQRLELNWSKRKFIACFENVMQSYRVGPIKNFVFIYHRGNWGTSRVTEE